MRMRKKQRRLKEKRREEHAGRRRLIRVSFCLIVIMEDSNLRDLIDEEVIMKTTDGVGFGLAAGSVWGAVVSMLYDEPRIERNVKYPQLIKTVKVSGNYAASFAALGGIYEGMGKALEKYRMKKDFVNGAVAAFSAGATVMGFKARGISTAVLSGSALALTSVLLDVTGMKTDEP